MKTSYSQNNTYISCPQHWKLNYIDRLESTTKGASLFFGSAIDSAIEELLKNNPNYMELFYSRWETSVSFGTKTPVFDNEEIIYGYADYDKDLFKSGDEIRINDWALELNLLPNKPHSLEELDSLYSEIVKLKKNMYKNPSSDQMKFFNRISWLSMLRKGEILIESFKNDFFPKIKKVISTQQYAKIQDHNTGDIISGYIDMILEIEGYDKPIIFDLKTASKPYSQDQIDLTDQLTLYSAMKGKYSYDSNKVDTDLVGYVVLSKAIPKEVEANCKTCGFTRDGRHKTCNNIINDSRCNGEWLEKKVPKPKVQVLVEQKSLEQVNAILTDIGNIILAMKNGIVYKNTSKCTNWYGSKCPYYNVCHKNKFDDVRKKS